MKRLCMALALLIAFEAPIVAQTATKKKKKTVQKSSRTTRTVRMKSVAKAQPKPDDGINHPSPYHGDNTPENDGQKKNEQRNINYNNTAQPLPANDGSK